MISLFSTPDRVKVADVLFVTVVEVVALLLIPASELRKMNVDWLFGVILLPLSFLVGLLSSWLFYRKHELTVIDPFYIRACWGLGGVVALPICLLVRPEVAHLAFILLTFSAGPVVAFHVFRRIRE